MVAYNGHRPYKGLIRRGSLVIGQSRAVRVATQYSRSDWTCYALHEAVTITGVQGWLREPGLHRRPSGYEPDALFTCATPRKSRTRRATGLLTEFATLFAALHTCPPKVNG